MQPVSKKGAVDLQKKKVWATGNPRSTRGQDRRPVVDRNASVLDRDAGVGEERRGLAGEAPADAQAYFDLRVMLKWVPGLKKGRCVSSTSPCVYEPNHSACTSNRSVTGTRRTTDGLQRLNQSVAPSG